MSSKVKHTSSSPSTSKNPSHDDASLLDLPPETLEHIFLYLPARCVANDLARTCKLLSAYSRKSQFWTHYLRRCKGYEPISSRVVDERPWQRAVAFDEEQRRWSTERCLQRYRRTHVHSTTVDAMALHCTRSGARLAVSGSRDRSLILWDINAIERNETPATEWHKLVNEAHTTWVWTIAIADNDRHVFSGGFDSFVKQWDLSESGLKETCQYNISTVPLSCATENDVLYVSNHGGKILTFDTRTKLQPQRSLQTRPAHPINSIASLCDSNYLYALSSQRGNIYCIDKRQMRLIRQSGGYKHCYFLQIDSESLITSCNDGRVHYVAPQTLERELTWSLPVSNEVTNIRPIRISHGAVVYASSYQLMLYTPGRNPRLLAELELQDQVISVDYHNGDLAVGLSNGHVLFWPRNNRRFELVDDANDLADDLANI